MTLALLFRPMIHLKWNKLAILFSLCLVFLLLSCSADSRHIWQRLVIEGQDSGFTPRNFQQTPYHLAGFLKAQGSSGTDLVVYIEGDGRAVSRGRVAFDPSPQTPLAFDLAKLDPAPFILYLARIGQYQPAQTGANYKAFWSNKRLAPEAVTAANLAIDKIKEEFNIKYIHLVGYSGGGGLAVLLAESRYDVKSLVTVAGLLDTKWWVEANSYLPLAGSLNPAAMVDKITNLPQLHFYGQKDKIIQPELSLHFSKLAPFTHLRRIAVETDHWHNWTKFWPQYIQEYLIILRSF